jgi:NodT family efflux transporter outer membrane factor (OMF) lipoprotein
MALLAGCASMGDRIAHSRPENVDGLQAHRTLAPAKLAEARWPATDWWKDLGDPQLDKLEAETLAGSPTLKMAKARVDKARALAGMAKSTLAPQVNANFQATYQRFSEHGVVPPPVAGSWRAQGQLALDAGYEFDFWGRHRAQLDAALGHVAAAKVDAFATRLLLSVQVARTYVELSRLYDQRDIAEATFTQRRKIYDLTRRRVAAGIDSRVELKQAEGALPASREAIAALNEAISRTRHQLAALLGQGPDRGLQIHRPALPGTNDAIALPSRLPAELLGRRPDVVAGRWRVEAAAQNIKTATASFYPNVDLLAYAGLQSLGLGHLLTLGSGIGGVGPAVTLPVFEGGRLRAQLVSTDANYNLAVERYNRILVEALHDIGDQIAAARSVKTQISAQRSACADAREAYKLARQRYGAGIGSYLSVLSAEAAVLQQRHLAVDLRARRLENNIDLVRALGGGFDETILTGHSAPTGTIQKRKTS